MVNRRLFRKHGGRRVCLAVYTSARFPAGPETVGGLLDFWSYLTLTLLPTKPSGSTWPSGPTIAQWINENQVGGG